jgi:hypothetical protein
VFSLGFLYLILIWFLENPSTRSHRDRRPSEKIVANRDFSPYLCFFLCWQVLGDIEEESARRQELLQANRAERAKRAERKAHKTNEVDRPAQSDDEERQNTSVRKLLLLLLYIST